MARGSLIDKLVGKPSQPFTLEKKERFLELYRSDPDMGGRKALCAEAVGSSAPTVDYHRKYDPEFAAAYDAARDCWVDENLVSAAVARARDGVERPMLGGKYRDEVVAHERVYSDSLMALLLKAHRKEYRDSRDSSPIDTAGDGGVMVIPLAPQSIEDWQANFGELSRPGPGDA